MSAYHYSESCWDYILPDGSAFCHWGGKDISRKIIERLDVKYGERVLDVCCGEAGTLRLLASKGFRLYGVDTSHQALQRADFNLTGEVKNGLVNLVEADAFEMPFGRNYFDKILAQDPDALLCPDKDGLMREIGRVSKAGARFVLQTYVETKRMDREMRGRASDVLKNLGYHHTELLCEEDILQLFTRNYFEVESIESLGSIYAKDNLSMIASAEREKDRIIKLAGSEQYRKILELLKLERHLFSQGFWNGVFVVANKIKRERNI